MMPYHEYDPYECDSTHSTMSWPSRSDTCHIMSTVVNLFTHSMDFDHSKASPSVSNDVKTALHHSLPGAMTLVPISLRLLSDSVISLLCYSGHVYLWCVYAWFMGDEHVFRWLTVIMNAWEMSLAHQHDPTCTWREVCWLQNGTRGIWHYLTVSKAIWALRS